MGYSYSDSDIVVQYSQPPGLSYPKNDDHHH